MFPGTLLQHNAFVFELGVVTDQVTLVSVEYHSQRFSLKFWNHERHELHEMENGNAQL